jgi:hypothetical protein
MVKLLEADKRSLLSSNEHLHTSRIKHAFIYVMSKTKTNIFNPVNPPLKLTTNQVTSHARYKLIQFFVQVLQHFINVVHQLL